MDLKKKLGMSFEDLVSSFTHQLQVEGLLEPMIAFKGEKALRAAINNSLGAVWMIVEAALEEAERRMG